MNNSEYAVTVKDLTRRFGKDFIAVDRISFNVEKARIYGFLGPNGAGKSTTIRMLCGILAPTSGSGSVGGFDIVSEAHKIKQTIGYMSQRFSLYSDLTVMQNLEFFAGIYKIPGKIKKNRIEFVLNMAGLSGKENVLTSELSGGWKQRLALGCSIQHDPEILFLDEPTAGVDPSARRNFWDLINDLKKMGVTIFVTTHYMDEAEHCDMISMIAGGRIVATASPRDLKKNALKGDMYSIAVSPLDQALRALRGLKQTIKAQVF